jgi:hypothetical protein
MAEENTAGDKPFAEKPTYDQNFFLALAAKGKDAWNEWRRDPANKNVRVTFEGIDFSVAPRDQINFSCFDFGNGADFSDCIWRGFNAIGLEALEIASNPDYFRLGCACFKAATFGFAANFDRVSFGSGASFCGATFDWVASFIGGTFGNDAKFNGATFRPLANFTGTTFGRAPSFIKHISKDPWISLEFPRSNGRKILQMGF